MKQIFLSFLFLGLVSAASAQVNMPQPSPKQKIVQDFGQGTIEIVYSRPAAKGRNIFGDLVPFGKLWRTGANAATRISFSEPVYIDGKKIDTGSYALYTIPGKDDWEIILNKGYNNPGAAGYKESEDVLRIKSKVQKISPKVESFTIEINDVKPTTCSVSLMWDNTSVSFPVEARFNDKLRAEIEEAMKGDKKPYWMAAQFYREYDSNNAKALESIKGALEQNPKAYWVWLYQARIQKDMGDKKGAIESSKKSLELATADNNADYIKLNKDFLKTLE